MATVVRLLGIVTNVDNAHVLVGWSIRKGLIARRIGRRLGVGVAGGMSVDLHCVTTNF